MEFWVSLLRNLILTASNNVWMILNADFLSEVTYALVTEWGKIPVARFPNRVERDPKRVVAHTVADFS